MTRPPTSLRSRFVTVAIVLAAMVVFLTLGMRAGEWWRQSRAGSPPARQMAPGAARASLDFNLDDLVLPREAIQRGGPAKDDIPALRAPAVCAASEADFLDDDERVVGVRIGGEARAYPLRVLDHHEAVNDELGGVPIAVVYCPLCDSVTVVDRRIGEETVEFGVSGLLYNSNVLLFDRRDDALWSQIGLRAVSGPNAGAALRHLDGWEVSTFAGWRDASPESTVMTLDTGHDRDYGRRPYAEYENSDRLWFPIARDDERLARKVRVIGVRCGDDARAYPIETIAGAAGGVVRDRLGGGEVELRVDAATGRVVITDVPENAAVVHTFWFAWAATHPETGVYGEPAEDGG